MSAIIILNNMAGTTIDSLLQSVQYTADMENGSLVALGGVVPNEHNMRYASTPSDVANQEVLLVASPEIVEVNGMRLELSDPALFTNPAGRPARAYRLKVADTFTITDDGLDGTTVVGQFVIPQDGSFKGVASATIGSTKISFKVIEKTKITVGRTRKDATKLEVVKEA